MHEYVRMYVGSGTRLVLVTGMSQKKKKKKKKRQRSRAEAGVLASAASLIRRTADPARI